MTHLHKRGAAALIIAALLALALLFTGCPNAAGGNGGGSIIPKYATVAYGTNGQGLKDWL